ATLAYFTSTSVENLDFTRAAVAAFMEEYPQIKVDLEQDGKDYPTKLQTRIAGGSPPDVPYGNNLLWQRLGIAKDSLDLNPYLAKDTKVKKDWYYPNMLVPVTVEGRLAGLPGTSAISMVYYNKQHF